MYDTYMQQVDRSNCWRKIMLKHDYMYVVLSLMSSHDLFKLLQEYTENACFCSILSYNHDIQDFHGFHQLY